MNNNTPSAIRLCKFHFSIAAATIKPPRKSTLVSLKYGVETCLEPSTPNSGKRTNGRRAVTAKSTTSVTQYTAMTRMQYAHRASWQKVRKKKFKKSSRHALGKILPEQGVREAVNSL